MHTNVQLYHPLMQVAALRKEHAVLVAKRRELEAAYRRFAIDECGMEEEHIAAKIAQARSAPQKSKRLQAIHEAHAAAASAEAAVKEAEGAAAALGGADAHGLHHAQVGVSLKRSDHWRRRTRSKHSERPCLLAC